VLEDVTRRASECHSSIQPPLFAPCCPSSFALRQRQIMIKLGRPRTQSAKWKA